MSRARQLATLILLGVLVLVLAIIVFVLARDVKFDLLAAIGILGGLAIIVNALPVNGKNGRNGNGKK